jgi:hypothetical protein
MQKLSEVAKIYEAAYRRVTVDLETGVVTWNYRPVKDFANKRYHGVWMKRFQGKAVGYRNGTRGGPGFVFMNTNLSVARLVARAKYGRAAYSKYVSFVDGDPWNLRGDNILLTKWHERTMRHEVRSDSGQLRVTRSGKRFVARYTYNKVRRYLGVFDTPELAAAAVKADREKLRG